MAPEKMYIAIKCNYRKKKSQERYRHILDGLLPRCHRSVAAHVVKERWVAAVLQLSRIGLANRTGVLFYFGGELGFTYEVQIEDPSIYGRVEEDIIG